MKKILSLILLASCLLIAVNDAFAHGGRTDRYGCHYNRKTGVYHCH